MNCCTKHGNCRQGRDCPFRSQGEPRWAVILGCVVLGLTYALIFFLGVPA